MSKGDYSIRFDPDRLRQMIELGMSARAIKKALHISDYTLKEHLLRLRERDKKQYVIHGLFQAGEAERMRRKARYKREGIVFSEKMLEKSGFKPGDAFEMIVESDRIILKKLPKKS